MATTINGVAWGNRRFFCPPTADGNDNTYLCTVDSSDAPWLYVAKGALIFINAFRVARMASNGNRTAITNDGA